MGKLFAEALALDVDAPLFKLDKKYTGVIKRKEFYIAIMTHRSGAQLTSKTSHANHTAYSGG